jgi:signal transduction histidine kinase
MGQGAPRWEEDVAPGARALARRDELIEVLVNLCENARDAGATTVTIAARTAKGRAVVEVRDDGHGIPPEVLPRIFEPRFSTTTSGSGLGLAIAKRLVESWGGTIGVETLAGRGTLVRLELKAEA